MRSLVDAQLPLRLARFLGDAGHTSQLHSNSALIGLFEASVDSLVQAFELSANGVAGAASAPVGASTSRNGAHFGTQEVAGTA